MFANAARAEVVNNRRQIRELAGGIDPDVSAMSFLRSRRQHLYRCFVGADNALRQHGFAQRINQRLELHAAVAHPLRQGRTGDGQPGAAEDFLFGDATADGQRTWPPLRGRAVPLLGCLCR